jgi:tagatose-1,6-bisphosphate aldolase non-catalytic subunit AgaZ/GatZ
MLLSAVISTLHNHLYHTQKTGKISTQHNQKLKVDTHAILKLEPNLEMQLKSAQASLSY